MRMFLVLFFRFCFLWHYSPNLGHLIHIVRCRVNYKTGFGLYDWLYCTLYIHTTRDHRQQSAIGNLHPSQFTVTHALGFSVLTSRNLVTDLSQSHCTFQSHMKSSLYSLITFLSFVLNHLRLPSPELDPILFRLLFSIPLHSSYFVPSSGCLLSQPLGTDHRENTACVID
jgi:hypothetical protein